MDCFVDLLKEKCCSATRNEKIKLLTLVPTSWSIQKTMEEFSVSQHMVKRAREIKKTKGILGDPYPKKGKDLLYVQKWLKESLHFTNLTSFHACALE